MPTALAASASNEDIIRFIDQWIGMLEAEKYEEASVYLDTGPSWSAELIRDIIKAYGEATDNKVTLSNNGTAVDGAGNVAPATQRKEVDYFDDSRGEVWYDLNINGLVSDLTATFDLKRQEGKLQVMLQDIHVM